MSATNSTFPPGYLDEYNGYKLMWLSSTFIAINVFCVGLRYYARYVSKTSIGADDYTTIFSLVFAIALSAMGISFVKYAGVGYHYVAILTRHRSKLGPFKKLTFAFGNIYFPSVMLPKLAMLFFYLRIFVQRWQRRACYILMGVLVATAVAAVIVNLTQCVPLEYAWTVNEVAGERCIKQHLFWSLISLPNIITDLIMLALPVPVICKIQLSWKDKVGLLFTFATGSIGTVTSILRFQGFIRYDPLNDPSWDTAELVIYSITEAGVYNIASCLPTYRSLYLSIRRQQPIPKPRQIRLKRYDIWHRLPSVKTNFKGEENGAFGDGVEFNPIDQPE